eukprot:765058-Hanusia_phi.AAC.1
MPARARAFVGLPGPNQAECCGFAIIHHRANKQQEYRGEEREGVLCMILLETEDGGSQGDDEPDQQHGRQRGSDDGSEKELLPDERGGDAVSGGEAAGGATKLQMEGSA